MNIDPIVFLSEIIQTDRSLIEEALACVGNYTIKELPRKNNTPRKVYLPASPLHLLQRILRQRCLSRLCFPLARHYNNFIFGLRKGSGSYIDHARKHSASYWFYQLDLQNAFPSVDLKALREHLLRRIIDRAFWLETAFTSYAMDTSDIFLNNTSVGKMILAGSDWSEFEADFRGLVKLILQLTTTDGIVPQGTPTAPLLFALALYGSWLTTFLSRLGKSEDFKISCYVDNIAVSSALPIPEGIRKELVTVVEQSGFRVNPQKTSYQHKKHGQVMLTGLRLTSFITQGGITCPKKKRRLARALLHLAISKPELRPRALGLVASMKPVYKKMGLPQQIRRPYEKLLAMIGT
ncbi:MAG: reverse transcriptase domain-containing protein [Patescibacteria group bacterium]|nr:reverse transcriptase domain-containing protein [Patescibacteria group bacterium]